MDKFWGTLGQPAPIVVRLSVPSPVRRQNTKAIALPKPCGAYQPGHILKRFSRLSFQPFVQRRSFHGSLRLFTCLCPGHNFVLVDAAWGQSFFFKQQYLHAFFSYLCHLYLLFNPASFTIFNYWLPICNYLATRHV